jgi:methylenetetrahydrofolate reductase (NADPH)
MNPTRGAVPAADPSFRERILAPGAFLTVVELVPWRGTSEAPDGRSTQALAASLAADPSIDALSVTDNAGGHAMASPEILARTIATAGGRPIVHVACRDRNRNELLSLGWRLASEGLDSILCVSGDYPVEGYGGVARPVFDLDSVGLLEMYRREGLIAPDTGPGGLFPGAVVNPHKRFEREVIPQYLKLEALGSSSRRSGTTPGSRTSCCASCGCAGSRSRCSRTCSSCPGPRLGSSTAGASPASR